MGMTWHNLKAKPGSRLRTPLHVPEEGQSVVALLQEVGVEPFIEELNRLSSLGAAWASAALGYYYLLPTAQRAHDLAQTKLLCTEPARRGNAYAQNVLAWCYFLSGRIPEAKDLIARAAKSNFGPAVVDAARFSQFGWGLKEPDPVHAEKLLRHAESLGSHTARVLRYEFYRQGTSGTFRQLTSYLLLPVLHLVLLNRAARSPFSESVFCVNAQGNGSLFQ